MIAILGVGTGFWAAVSALMGGAALWSTQTREKLTPEQELYALMLRERHPVKWAFKHPAKAIERLFR